MRTLMIPAAPNGFSPKFIFRAIRKRIPMFALAFAVLFTIIADAQYLFVRHEVYKSAELQFEQWADQVAAEIAYEDKWDLAGHRQSGDIQAPHAFVFTSDGTCSSPSRFWNREALPSARSSSPRKSPVSST